MKLRLKVIGLLLMLCMPVLYSSESGSYCHCCNESFGESGGGCVDNPVSTQEECDSCSSLCGPGSYCHMSSGLPEVPTKPKQYVL
jgi:hypothetical protein